jgi:hypothetical protein
VTRYYLVWLRPTGRPAPDHEPFVDSLIERDAILLGGPVGGAAAYVLRCAEKAEADRIVATDPLVTSGAATATVTEWQLVGVNLRAIDPDLWTIS